MQFTLQLEPVAHVVLQPPPAQLTVQDAPAGQVVTQFEVQFTSQEPPLAQVVVQPPWRQSTSHFPGAVHVRTEPPPPLAPLLPPSPATSGPSVKS